MKLFSVIALLVILSACVAQSPKQNTAQSKEDLSFRICDSESFFALTLARQYLMGNMQRDAVLPYLSSSKDDQDAANEVFTRFESGEFRHYANYAAEKLYSCAKKEGASISVPKYEAIICFAKVDIPFFLHLEKSNGLNKQDAIDSVDRRLKNKDVYPRELIGEVANKVFPSTTIEENRRAQHALFWSCMYP